MHIPEGILCGKDSISGKNFLLSTRTQTDRLKGKRVIDVFNNGACSGQNVGEVKDGLTKF